MNVLKQAVKITLRDRYVARPEIGLYTPADTSMNSELRWSKHTIYNAEEEWKSGIVSSISPISRKVNFKHLGGGVMADSTMDINIYNNDQLSLKLEELEIYLQTQQIEIYEFEGTSDDSDSVGVIRRETGVIDAVYEWDNKEISLKITCGRQHKRACLGFELTKTNRPYLPDSYAGNILPVTFGASDPANKCWFKMIRTNARDEELTPADLHTAATGVHDAGDCTLFPAVTVSGVDYGVVGTRTVSLSTLCWRDSQATPIEINSLVGKYVNIAEADGDSTDLQGINRQIAIQTVQDGTITANGESLISSNASFYLQDYMPVAPKYTDNIFCKIKAVEIEHETCGKDGTFTAGFFDSVNGNTSRPEVYVKDNDKVIRVMQANADVEYDSKRIRFNPRIIKGDGDTLQCVQFVPLPITEYDAGTVSTANPLDGWDFESSGDMRKKMAGIYGHVSGVTVSNKTTTGSLDNVITPDAWTGYGTQFTVSGEFLRYALVYHFQLPDISEKLDFDNVYLGIRAKSFIDGGTVPSDNGGSFMVKLRNLQWRLQTPVQSQNLEFDGSDTTWIEDVPDFYFNPAIPTPTGSNRFIIERDESHLYTGLNKFNLNITSHDQYKNFTEGLIVISKWLAATGTARTGTDQTQIYNVCLIFEKSVKIGDEIYV